MFQKFLKIKKISFAMGIGRQSIKKQNGVTRRNPPDDSVIQFSNRLKTTSMPNDKPPSLLFPVTMFVLLPAAAWARVVSADDFFFHNRLNPLNGAAVAGRLSRTLGSLL